MGLPGMEQGAAPRHGVGGGSSGLNAQPSGLPLKRPSLKKTAGEGLASRTASVRLPGLAWMLLLVLCQPTLEGR